jgi:hypothetical protein
MNNQIEWSAICGIRWYVSVDFPTMPYSNRTGSFSCPSVYQMGFYDITKENVFNIFNTPFGMTPEQAAKDPVNYIYH